MKRPTPPEHLRDLLFAKWDPELNRYVLKQKTKPKPGICIGKRCRHKLKKYRVCDKCRKRMQTLNSPISVRLGNIRSRIRSRANDPRRGKGHAFSIDSLYARELLIEQGLWEDFHECPAAFHLDRINPLSGYEEGNVRWTTAQENLEKSAEDKKKHQEARKGHVMTCSDKEEHVMTYDSPTDDEDPF